MTELLGETQQRLVEAFQQVPDHRLTEVYRAADRAFQLSLRDFPGIHLLELTSLKIYDGRQNTLLIAELQASWSNTIPPRLPVACMWDINQNAAQALHFIQSINPGYRPLEITLGQKLVGAKAWARVVTHTSYSKEHRIGIVHWKEAQP